VSFVWLERTRSSPNAELDNLAFKAGIRSEPTASLIEETLGDEKKGTGRFPPILKFLDFGRGLLCGFRTGGRK